MGAMHLLLANFIAREYSYLLFVIRHAIIYNIEITRTQRKCFNKLKSYIDVYENSIHKN